MSSGGNMGKNGSKQLDRAVLFSVSHGIWMIFLVIFVIGLIFIPGFAKFSNIVNVMWGNVSFGFLVLGMFIVLLTGQTDLSIESTFAIAPIMGAIMMLNWFPKVVSPSFAILIVLVTGCLVGFINSLLSVYLEINSFLVTLTMLLVLRGMSEYIIPEGLYYLPETFIALGNQKIGGFPIALGIFIILAITLLILTRKTEFGKNLYATGSSERAAYLAGVDVKKVKTIAFILSGFFAALGGLTSAGRMQAVTADMGSGDVMTVFAACFLGGASMSGGKGDVVDLIGAILTLSIITNILNLRGVNPFLINVIYGLILLFAIVFAKFQQVVRQNMLIKIASCHENA